MKFWVKTKNIVNEFADAICAGDLKTINSLLSNDLTADVLHEKEIIFNKTQFVTWLTETIENNKEKLTYKLDQCSHCILGASVILFNPQNVFYSPPDDGYKEKGGLAIETKDNFITNIKLCFVFLKTENPFVYEVKGKKLSKFIKGTGLSFDECWKLIE